MKDIAYECNVLCVVSTHSGIQTQPWESLVLTTYTINPDLPMTGLQSLSPRSTQEKDRKSMSRERMPKLGMNEPLMAILLRMRYPKFTSESVGLTLNSNDDSGCGSDSGLA